MKAVQLTDQLYEYLLSHTAAASEVLPQLALETRGMEGGNMQIAPEQGQLMNILVKLIGAKRILEIGCFTGYSAIAMAAALPEDGKLITLDINQESTAVARRYFAAAGLEKRIELRLAPALESLTKLEQELGCGSFDLMFIDADKENMSNYYEWGLKLLRRGGLLIVDNVLWGGSVVDPSDQTPSTVAIRAFNDLVRRDPRTDSVMINVADGLHLCRKV